MERLDAGSLELGGQGVVSEEPLHSPQTGDEGNTCHKGRCECKGNSGDPQCPCSLGMGGGVAARTLGVRPSDTERCWKSVSSCLSAWDLA